MRGTTILARGDPPPAGRYGWRVRAFEIEELRRERYREREQPTPALEPSGAGWNGAKMHHLDAHRLRDGSWKACVDGYGVD